MSSRNQPAADLGRRSFLSLGAGLVGASALTFLPRAVMALAFSKAVRRGFFMEKAVELGARKADAEFDRIAQSRPKVTFLSATPFAYEKNTDWANGYLYDYGATFDGRTGYNAGSARDQFMIRHFGYRMRTGKLTEPGPEVDRGLMQRGFNSWLKREGVLSGRMLDVPFDYDRRFQSVESGIGNRIDEALAWLNENEPGRSALREMINGQFDSLTRRRILEGNAERHAFELDPSNFLSGCCFHDQNLFRGDHCTDDLFAVGRKANTVRPALDVDLRNRFVSGGVNDLDHSFGVETGPHLPAIR